MIQSEIKKSNSSWRALSIQVGHLALPGIEKDELRASMGKWGKFLTLGASIEMRRIQPGVPPDFSKTFQTFRFMKHNLGLGQFYYQLVANLGQFLCFPTEWRPFQLQSQHVIIFQVSRTWGNWKLLVSQLTNLGWIWGPHTSGNPIFDPFSWGLFSWLGWTIEHLPNVLPFAGLNIRILKMVNYSIWW